MVGAGVAVVALVAALVWFVGLPRYRPGLHDGERYGIDVSAHQGRISWSDVARDGISFAYVAHVGSGLPVTFCEAYSQHFPEGMWAGVYSYQHPDFLPDSYYDPAWLHPAMGAVAKPM